MSNGYRGIERSANNDLYVISEGLLEFAKDYMEKLPMYGETGVIKKDSFFEDSRERN